MLPDSIELIIVTPERQLLRESVVEVTLPGAEGQLGVLPGHAPLITELGIGELNYRAKNGAGGTMAIISGFAEVLGDRITVLAETLYARPDFGYAVRFVDVPVDTRLQLIRLIQSIRERPPDRGSRID